jgi:hypothetical protein
MVDIKKVFNLSFGLLNKNKKIIIPVLISIALPIILILLFLNLSGIVPLFKELTVLNEQFAKEKTDYLMNLSNVKDDNYSLEMLNYLGKDSENSAYQKDFDAYLKENGYDWNRYQKLINTKNIVMLVAFLLFGFIASFYFSCMSFAYIALSMKNTNPKDSGNDINKLLNSTNYYFFKLLSFRIIIGFIIFAPLLIIIIIVASLFFLNTIASMIFGFLALFIFIILFFAYVIYVSLRLIFVIPSMYLEGEGAITSVEHSYQITKGHVVQVLAVFFIMYGLNVFINSFFQQPLNYSLSGAMFGTTWFAVIVNVVLMAIFLILESSVFALEQIFLFYSYLDYKEEFGKGTDEKYNG